MFSLHADLERTFLVLNLLIDLNLLVFEVNWTYFAVSLLMRPFLLLSFLSRLFHLFVICSILGKLFLVLPHQLFQHHHWTSADEAEWIMCSFDESCDTMSKSISWICKIWTALKVQVKSSWQYQINLWNLDCNARIKISADIIVGTAFLD